MKRVACLLVILSLGCARGERSEQLSEAEEAVMAPINALFDAMRAADTVALQQIFDTNARIITTSVRDGSPVSSVIPIAPFISAVGGSGGTLDERIWDSDVRIDDNLAAVWTKYDFVRAGEFSHCGVDSIQLIKTSGSWKIVHVVDTQRREECWRAPE